jgi:hypothetical protein
MQLIQRGYTVTRQMVLDSQKKIASESWQSAASPLIPAEKRAELEAMFEAIKRDNAKKLTEREAQLAAISRDNQAKAHPAPYACAPEPPQAAPWKKIVDTFNMEAKAANPCFRISGERR